MSVSSALNLLAKLSQSGIAIHLENDKLKISGAEEKLTPGLIDELKQNKADIIAFLQEKSQKKCSHASIENVEKKEYYRLSSAQKRLYFLQQINRENTGYNLQEILFLDKSTTIETLKAIFIKLAARHEGLRTSFALVHGEPVQKINNDIPLEISYYEGNESQANEESKVREIIRNFIRPFDLSRAPLVRLGAIKVKKTGYIIVIDMHHIITDGASLNILTQEFKLLFTGETLPALKLQYKDYSEWQNNRKISDALKQQETYWLREFAGEIPLLTLPFDFPRPPVKSFAGNLIDFELNLEESNQLRMIARTGEATLFMVLLGIFSIMLAKIGNREDIVVGTPNAGRDHADLEKIIGMFVNTIALRNYPSGGKTVTSFLQEVKARTLAAFENQDYQFEDLVEKIMVQRDMSRNPIFDVMLVMENNTGSAAALNENNTSQFDLILLAFDNPGKLDFAFNYCVELFKQETVLRFICYFKSVMASLMENPGQKLSEIEIISPGEKKQILYDFNNTQVVYPWGKTIHGLFAERAEKIPDGIALVGADLRVCPNHLTYHALNEKSDNMAGLLIEKGAGPEQVIAIMIAQPIELIIGILGILKSGGAYLPIEPGSPQERIDYMLKDSAARILITNNEKKTDNCQLSIVNSQLSMNEARASHPHSCQLAYIIYTSGTTGKPKGVMVDHRSIFNTIYWRMKEYKMKIEDRALQLFSFAFDGFITSFFTPIVSGASIVQLSRDVARDIPRMKELMVALGITHFICVPSLYHSLLEISTEKDFARLKIVTLAGEQVPPGIIAKSKKLNPLLEIVNEYGPTESSVVVSIGRDIQWGEIISIGKPIANARVYLIDKYENLVPVGIPGELVIAGSGLSRGYLNNPELTRGTFEKAPADTDPPKLLFNYHSPLTTHHSPIYKTGDLARWLPNGTLEFIGRIDRQVKIRGFRIETGEIESRLLNHEWVREALVVERKKENSENYLCAYITVKKEFDLFALKPFLLKYLPDYMIPAYFIKLDQIPLNPNGKIDRHALPEPGFNETDFIAPRDEIEKKLIEIWAEVLQIDKTKIGINSDFFQLGGHSLKAVVLASRIHKELNVQVPLAEIFNHPAILGLAEYIQGTVSKTYESIPPVEKKEYYELSPAQKRLYILQQMNPASVAYNIPAVIHLPGNVDIDILTGVFRSLIKRHESLRTSFHMLNNIPVQRIHHEIEFTIKNVTSWALEAFDLSRAPLLRAGLLNDEKGRCVLFVDMHHIITDGASHEILKQDFMALYKDKDKGEILPDLRIQYKDFAIWQNSHKEKGSWEKQEIYWLNEFAGEIPVLKIPTDYPRPAVQDFAGGHIDFEISPGNTGFINIYAGAQGVTLYMMLLALVNILLGKISGQEDIIIGSPIAGRRHADLENIIGMFVNTLALRNYPIGEKTFTGFLEELKKRTLEAFENQEYPFEDLVDKVMPERHPERNPLFDVMFVLQNIGNGPGTEITYPNDDHIQHTAKFDLEIMAREVGAKLEMSFEYGTQLFTRDTIERFIIYFNRITAAVLDEPGIKISDIEIISCEEKKQVLYEFNNTRVDYPGTKTIPQLFAEQVENTPDGIAIAADAQNYPVILSYHELNEQSFRLSGLLKEKGGLPGDIIGIMLERSPEMIIGILGILKAGGAYMPIDPGYPRERIDYMLKDSQAVLLLTHDKKKSKGQLSMVNFQWSMSGRLRRVLQHSSHLAYIIYTSGTTGRPKGVMIEHRNVIRLVKNTNYIVFRQDDRILPTGALEFDASTFEIWGTLLNGLSLCLIEKEKILASESLKKAIQKYSISTMWMTSPLFNQLIQEDIEIFKGLKNIIVGGDMLSPVHINRLRARYTHLAIINGYGPTENTTFSTTFSIEREYIGSIPIGKPINNSYVYILDKYNHVQPIGVSGEIYVGGDGVGRGYLNNIELTAEKFGPQISLMTQIPQMKNKSFFGGDRGAIFSKKAPLIYKTGDLGRWLPDSNIEFLGRVDTQVKIRGFRIELEEIENRLLENKNIREAVVLAREEQSGNKVLVAYIVPGAANKNFDTAELRDALSGRLPGYMVPAYFVKLDKIPLTPNGKIDRKSLPFPGFNIAAGYVPPRDETEWQLVEIWSDLLGIEKSKISIHDNFFEIGGHSLKAMILVSNIHKIFAVKVPLVEIFKLPTVSELTIYIKSLAPNLHVPIEAVEKKEYYPLSPAQKRLYILYQLVPDTTVYNMPQVIPLPGDLDKEKLEIAFKKLIARHESLRTSFAAVNEEPVQRIHQNVDFTMTGYHVSGSKGSEGGEEGQIISHFTRPFDLSKAPLLRVGFLTREALGSDQTHAQQFLLIDMHHIITDGVSQEILTKEFQALCLGEKLPSLQLHYKDYAVWYHSTPQQKAISRQKDYWLQGFSGDIRILELPNDYPRPLTKSFAGNMVNFYFNSEETRFIKTAAWENDVTLYMCVLAIFNILLAKLSGQEDIIIGTPVAARRHVDLLNVIGMFVNTLAMRNYPSGDKTFKEFLKEVRKQTLGAYENQEFPFEILVDHITAQRDAGRNPIFEVMFNLLNHVDDGADNPAKNDPGFYRHTTENSKFDLTLTAVEIGTHIELIFTYSTMLFLPATIERMIGYFKNIVHALALETENVAIFKIEIMADDEKKSILEFSNGPSLDGLPGTTLTHLFENQVERTPDNIAVVYPGAHLTYRALNRRANHIAGLLQERNINRGSVVGIMMKPSLEMITAMLGILKAGCAFCPVEPESPIERINFTSKDSAMQLLLTQSHLAIALDKQIEILNMDDDLLYGRELILQGDKPNSSVPVYVIYTSGTTGKPKGVLITHQNLVNYIYWFMDIIHLTPGDKSILNSSFAFDALYTILFSTLLMGCEMHVIPREVFLYAEQFINYLRANQITFIKMTPSLFNSIVNSPGFLPGVLPEIRFIMLGGEEINVNDVEKVHNLYPHVIMMNHYGPTETTIGSIARFIDFDSFSSYKNAPTIGKPLANSGAYILDKHLQLLPVRVAGELYISGAGVGLGYLNRPELTAEKFRPLMSLMKNKINKSFAGVKGGLFQKPSPFVYKTGDLARWLPDGPPAGGATKGFIEFLGRIDNQVKIRGNRVELGEIENRLMKYPEIKEVVLMARPGSGGDKFLCAYLVSDHKINVPGLKEYLLNYLPNYMIPSYFIQVDRIPLTVHAKTDYRALPEPVPGGGEDYLAPRDELERKLVEIWAGVLNLDKEFIGIDANFFALGGHSLKATILSSRIHKELNVKVPLPVIFKLQKIAGLAEYIRNINNDAFQTIAPAEKKEYYPMSSAQKRLYLLQNIELNNTAYNMPNLIRLDKELEGEWGPGIEKLTKTFRELLQRHESLRTSFEMINEEPVQRIWQDVNITIDIYESEAEEEEIIYQFTKPFDLSRPPLVRLSLLKRKSLPSLLLVDIHHLISDAASNEILRKEFQIFYSKLKPNTPVNLPPLRIHYKDYAEWQNKHPQEHDIKELENYWLSMHAGEIPVLQLPTDFPRPLTQSFAGSTVHFLTTEAETRSLKTLLKETGITLFMLIFSAFAILLSKLSGQEDIIVGIPTAGRRHADLEGIIGMFVNTLAIRLFPVREKKYHDFLAELKKRSLEAFENQDYPFDQLVDKIALNRDAGRNPLFDVMFNLLNLESQNRGSGIHEPKFDPGKHHKGISQFDLTLTAIEQGDRILFIIEYCNALFKSQTIDRFISYFEIILALIPGHINRELGEMEIITQEEKKWLLEEFNNTGADYPANKTIHQLFAEQAEKKPECIAVVGADLCVCPNQLTYQALNEQAGRLASILKSKGVAPDTIVAVKMERSIELIIGILGILKAGGAYLPIDPDYPGERIDYMLKDSNAKIIINKSEIRNPKFETNPNKTNSNDQNNNLGASSVLNFEHLDLNSLKGCPRRGLQHSAFELPRVLHSDTHHLAYVIYTSGSTGKPKGLASEHRNVINLLTWFGKNFALNPGTRVLQLTDCSFDPSIEDIFGTLSYGGVLFLSTKETSVDKELFRQVIEKFQVNMINFVPRLLAELLCRGEKLKSLQVVISGGEHLEDSLKNKILEKGYTLYNNYGPTEITVDALSLKCSQERVTLGKPAANVTCYILSGESVLAPIGVPGELYIGGAGVARGYLNRPELTYEKFRPQITQIKNKSFFGGYRGAIFSKKAPLVYKTGDLVRWVPDFEARGGFVMEFLGRTDYQVKIKGFRIELGEIEIQLMRHESILEAIAVCQKDKKGDNFICAYIVSKNKIPASGLREYLSARLPKYMIPSYFVNLEKIPLKANGKIDQESLPGHEGGSLTDRKTYRLPTNPIEKKILETWKKVLNKQDISLDENFFLLGGDSIKAIQFISRLSSAGYKLEMKDLFTYPVIAQLAPHVKKLKRMPEQSAITGEVPLTPIQKAFFQEAHPDAHHFNQAVMFYAQEGFNKEAIQAVFRKIQEHHDALRMTYHINKENGNIMQINHGLDYPLSLAEYDFENFEERVEQLQAGIDLEKGPLLKLGLFHGLNGQDNGDRLLVVIHHLVIDGISWRILFEDIETLYGQYQRGEKLNLPPKSDPFKLWAEKLSAYANSPSFLKEKNYWSRLESYPVPLLPKDKEFSSAENNAQDVQNVSFSLEEKETGLLLTRVSQAFGTAINDILLTALGLALKNTFGQDRVLIALEGHGREEILKELDISRTIGWFTSIYPLLMDISYADKGRQIKEIKETLRQIPHKGIGYGVLKYLSHEEYKKDMTFKLKPEISFNYLGQFDTDVKQISSFQITGESPGRTVSIRNRREYELEVSGMTANNRLTMTIAYNKTHFKTETMTALIDHFQSALSEVIAYCVLREKREFTPADFTFKGLSIEGVEQLMDRYPDIEDLYTLTPMQEGMLFHALNDAGAGQSSYSYFEQTSYRLQGALAIGLVEKSLNQLFKRHDILRTAFTYKEIELPVQVVLKDRTVDFYYQDIRDTIEISDKENYLREFKARDKERSFDLTRDVLMRVAIFRLAEAEYEFTWSFHHILMDGWCLGILNTEFFEIYNSYLEKRSYRLPNVNPYRTYIQWLEQQDKEESLTYWENYLDSFTEQTGVPGRKIPDLVHGQYKNEQVSVELDREKSAMLNKLAVRNHVTLNTFMQTLWGILLGKYNNKTDVVFGAVVSGRPSELPGIESMVGLFINTIPIRINFNAHKTFNKLIRETQGMGIAAEPYHYCPLAEIQSRSPLKQNLIDHLFIFENYPLAEQIEGYGDKINENSGVSLKLTHVEVFEQTNYDFIFVLGGAELLTLVFKYNGHVYDSAIIERMVEHFKLLLDQVIDNEELEIGSLTLLTGEEKKRILNEFNNTETDYPENKTIHQLFAEQMEKSPDHMALVGADLRVCPSRDVCLTYRQLNKQADRLAGLLTEKGVLPDDIVGIMMERSIDLIIGIMGILKSGGAYLPIDPEYPKERIDYMLKDSNAKIIINKSEIRNPKSETNPNKTNSNNQNKNQNLGAASVLNFEHLDLNSLTGCPRRGLSDFDIRISNFNFSDIAYVIYTSGSTGRPKGVMVEHRSIFNTIYWRKQEYKLGVNDRTLQLFSFAFDGFLTSFFTPIVSGASVVQLGSEKVKDIYYINKIIVTMGVTHFICVPSLYRMILEISTAAQLSCLKVVTLAGEQIPPGLLERSKQLNPLLEIVNEYGPTEGSVVASVHRDISPGGEISIGKPIANCGIYITDKDEKLLPIGIPGQLVIFGKGAARGYLNNPELTSIKFLSVSSVSSVAKIYKTGDLARWLSNGNIEFLGRIDNQVKIRGFRIELGEIETQLLKFKKIKEAAVIAKNTREETDKQLYAYLETGEKLSPAELTELKDYLAAKLPGYMIPTFFVQVDKIPLTLSGKLDRNALPEPGKEDNINTGYSAPGDEIEEKLSLIWAEILGLKKEQIGSRYNFFDLGGNSLHLIKLLAKIYNEFGAEITISQLYQTPTIQEIAKSIKSRKYIDEPVVLLNQPRHKKLFLFPPGVGFGIAYQALANIIDDYSCYSFNFLEDDNRLNKYIEIIKNLQPFGPYILFGWSAPGKLMFKLTEALENQGSEVSDIILADCFWHEKKDTGNETTADEDENNEFMSKIEKQMQAFGLGHLKEKVQEKTKNYLAFIQGIEKITPVHANIHLIISGESQAQSTLNINCWNKYTTKQIMMYNGFGSHNLMFSEGPLEKNAEIIKKILIGIESERQI